MSVFGIVDVIGLIEELSKAKGGMSALLQILKQYE